MKLSSLPPSLSTSRLAASQCVLPEASKPELSEPAPQLTPNPPAQKQVSQEWAVFASTFVTIFLAEIGDKTQLTTLLMAAQSHAPWIVFAGAGLALVLTSLLGVLLGQWLATRIAPKTLERSAGVSLLLIAVMLAWDVLH